MSPRFWCAITKRCKDAGSPDSGAIGTTEDAAAHSVIACQKPEGHRGEGHSAALLGAVLRAGLLAIRDAARVERGPDDLVAEAREVLDAAAAHEHDRVLLQVVALARDVGADLHAVREPDARDLPEGRVRLLRGGRVDARADAPLLRGPGERGRL